MGISINTIRFLQHMQRRGVKYTRTLMLGRQALMPPLTGYAEPIFSRLGAECVHSMDVSQEEAPTFIHDLQEPPPEHLIGHYTVVYDGGTLEHIYETTTALRHALLMVAPNGHFVSGSPGNGMMGHGFYQFSAEYWYRALRYHGFQPHVWLTDGRKWYYVLPPEDITEWPIISQAGQLFFSLIGQNTGVRADPPQQCNKSVMPQKLARLRILGLWLYRINPAMADCIRRRLFIFYARLNKNAAYTRCKWMEHESQCTLPNAKVSDE